MKQYITLTFSFVLMIAVNAQVKETLPPSYRDTNVTNKFRAEAEQLHNLIHTKLDVKFDFEKEHLMGEEWVTLTPHFYATNQLTLDAKAMLIHEVALMQGNNKKKLDYTYNDEQLNITLDKVYNKGEKYTLYIKYTARPNEVKQEGSAAISDAKGLYFINPRGEEPNKPTQIWTQGETESSSCWFPTIDKPNQKTSQEIYMTVPDKYVTLSNGIMEESTKNSDGTRTDYWNFDKKHAPYLFFMGVGDYAIIKDKWKNIAVDYYVEHEYAPYAKEIFGDTPAMIEYFSKLLNYPFPWQKYSQIVSREYVSGAMENTTAVIFFDRTQQKPGQLIDENIAEGIVAHELFHHWFGDLVTTESWGNLTVNESLANYSEYLWFEHKYGKERAEEDRFDDLNGYKLGDNFNKNLVRTHYINREDMFDGVSYNKGGKGVLHMLRNFLGDEAFFGGLSKYLHDHEYGKAEAVQIRLAMEEVSGRDLNWFFDQWYFSNGHPKLNVAYDYDASNKKIKVSVVQSQEPLFEFPFTIDVVIDGKTTRHQLWAKKETENIFELDASKNPDVVIPNADQVLLCDINDTKPVEAFIQQYKTSKEYGSKRLAIDAIANAQATNTQALQTLIDATNDEYFGLRVYALSKLDMTNADAKNKATANLKKLAQKDPKTLVQAAAYKALVDGNVKDIALYEDGTKSKSFSVQADAVSGLIKFAPERTSEIAKNLSDEVLESNPELIADLLPTWITSNDTSKLVIATESSALYSFTKYQNPELGSKLEKGFKWIMSSDDTASTTKAANFYKQVYGYIKNNPQALTVLKQTVQEALSLKKKTAETKPSKTITEQVELLQNVLESLK